MRGFRTKVFQKFDDTLFQYDIPGKISFNKFLEKFSNSSDFQF